MRTNDVQLFASRKISPDLYIARMKIHTQKVADWKKENSHEKKVTNFFYLIQLFYSVQLQQFTITIQNDESFKGIRLGRPNHHLKLSRTSRQEMLTYKITMKNTLKLLNAENAFLRTIFST